jgi:adenosine deaminase
MADHPVDRMLAEGLRVTLNSDDPAYFGGYINANYLAAAQGRGLTRDQLVTIAENSFKGAFLPHEDKERHLAAVRAYANRAGVPTLAA